jgi:hypothetical protein
MYLMRIKRISRILYFGAIFVNDQMVIQFNIIIFFYKVVHELLSDKFMFQ